jgi:hypothetical protein
MKYTLLPAISTVVFSVSSLLPALAEGGYTPPNNGAPDAPFGTGTRVSAPVDCSPHRGRDRRNCLSLANFQALSASPSVDCSPHRGRDRRNCLSIQ